jgi:hypothetical protein
MSDDPILPMYNPGPPVVVTASLYEEMSPEDKRRLVERGNKANGILVIPDQLYRDHDLHRTVDFQYAGENVEQWMWFRSRVPVHRAAGSLTYGLLAAAIGTALTVAALLLVWP